MLKTSSKSSMVSQTAKKVYWTLVLCFHRDVLRGDAASAARREEGIERYNASTFAGDTLPSSTKTTSDGRLDSASITSRRIRGYNLAVDHERGDAETADVAKVLKRAHPCAFHGASRYSGGQRE